MASSAYSVRADLIQLSNNPFQKPVLSGAQEAEEEPALELMGVLVSKHTPLANFNGQILSIGDQIAGYRLLSVSESSAILFKNGVEFKFSVGDFEFANPPE